MPLSKPAFVITIDTEGDNLWSRPRVVSTENARFLPRFQKLCEEHGLKPTWLTNYEMAVEPRFVQFGMDVLRRGAGEIGMHLHAWDSPPVEFRRTEDDYRTHPYLIEFPEGVVFQKIQAMTNLLEGTFSEKMVSHRAGRWALDTVYARTLEAHGYLVDCSVTPGVSWRGHSGAPDGIGGVDYRHFPASPYFLDLNEIRLSGHSRLLEVPVTIFVPKLLRDLPAGHLADRLRNRAALWLRPVARERNRSVRALQRAIDAGSGCLVFILHSSELMPGGSPNFTTSESIEELYRELEALFRVAGQRCRGVTLGEFRREFDSGWCLNQVERNGSGLASASIELA